MEYIEPQVGDLLLDSYDNGAGTRWAELYPATVGYIVKVEKYQFEGPQGANYDTVFLIKWIYNPYKMPHRMPGIQLKGYLGTSLKLQRKGFP